MRSTIGGRQLEITRQEVSRRMKHVEPEPARQHEVLVDGVWFHPSKCCPGRRAGRLQLHHPGSAADSVTIWASRVTGCTMTGLRVRRALTRASRTFRFVFRR